MLGGVKDHNQLHKNAGYQCVECCASGLVTDKCEFEFCQVCIGLSVLTSPEERIEKGTTYCRVIWTAAEVKFRYCNKV